MLLAFQWPAQPMHVDANRNSCRVGLDAKFVQPDQQRAAVRLATREMQPRARNVALDSGAVFRPVSACQRRGEIGPAPLLVK
jgi:hypothetical protein